MWLFPRVDANVDFQSVGAPERLAAIGARVGLLPLMDPHVLIIRVTRPERLPAHVAFEGTLSRVLALVRVSHVFQSERFVADLARVRFLSGVQSRVRVQMRALHEPLAALQTHEGLLARVRASMQNQRPLLRELLGAILALERQLPRVVALVRDQRDAIGERLPAFVALEGFGPLGGLVHLLDLHVRMLLAAVLDELGVRVEDERSPADAASVRPWPLALLVEVRQGVLLEESLSREAAPALLALERLDVEVREVVALERGLVVELASADVALEGPLARVHALVRDEARLELERLAAQVAAVRLLAQVHQAHVVEEVVLPREHFAAVLARHVAASLVDLLVEGEAQLRQEALPALAALEGAWGTAARVPVEGPFRIEQLPARIARQALRRPNFRSLLSLRLHVLLLGVFFKARFRRKTQIAQATRKEIGFKMRSCMRNNSVRVFKEFATNPTNGLLASFDDCVCTQTRLGYRFLFQFRIQAPVFSSIRIPVLKKVGITVSHGLTIQFRWTRRFVICQSHTSFAA